MIVKCTELTKPPPPGLLLHGLWYLHAPTRSLKATPPFKSQKSSIFPIILGVSLCSSVFSCSHWFFRELMWAQILSAGPSLMFMLVMRWSSVSSSRACPSISCSRKASATSLQPVGGRGSGCQRSEQKKVFLHPLFTIWKFPFLFLFILLITSTKQTLFNLMLSLTLTRLRLT